MSEERNMGELLHEKLNRVDNWREEDARRASRVKKIDGIRAQREFIKELKQAHATLTPGPYEWGPYAGDKTHAEYTSETLSHGGDPEGKLWLISIPETEQEWIDKGVNHVTIATVGNGPNSRRNAQAMAFLLNNSAALISLAEAFIEQGEAELEVNGNWQSFQTA